MKKTLLSLFTLAIVSISNAQNVNIPDANFKTYLLGNTAININADTEISVNEATNFAGMIWCDASGITDMTGLEAFTNLSGLKCEGNSISSLDLTTNTSLGGTITVNNNVLTTLILPPTSTITELYCGNNNLTSLDLSVVPNLTLLHSVWNSFATLDVSNNTVLNHINFGGSPLTSIDLTGLTSLTYIACQSTGLTTLDISPATALTGIYGGSMADLTELNMANGNNMSMAPGDVVFTGAPNLTCVTVDNVALSNQIWPPYFDAGVTFSNDCSQGGNILATDVTVNGFGGASTVEVGSTLQMEGVILPANASSQVLLWQVTNGTGTATIDMNSGILTGVSIGMVTVGAAAIDGSNQFGTIEIEVIEAVGLTDLNKTQMTLYPNPTESTLTIASEQMISNISIFNVSGTLVQTEITSSFSVERLQAGVYFVNVKTSEGVSQMRFIKK